MQNKDIILELVEKEKERQEGELSFIASENLMYPEVAEVLGGALAQKYAEGYVGKRYYQGNKIIDEIERETIERAKKLFGVESANVQPYSGSPANMAVLFALVEVGDKIAGLGLSSGGHLTHGHPGVTFSGKYFKSVQYGVDENGRIDYEKTREMLLTEKPKLIFVGTTSYPYKLDFEFFGKVAEEIGAYVVADISHIAGLVATGLHPDPVPHVHLVTTTTHKMLRGPRGGIVMVTKKGVEKNPDLPKLIDRAVFPGLQGGPHMDTIAGIGIALGKAMENDYKLYCKKVIDNSIFLAESLREKGLKVYGTENHLMVVDCGAGNGKKVAVVLEEMGIIVNANSIPHDSAKPFSPSGIRLGTPWVTSRGISKDELEEVAKKIGEVAKREELEK